MSMTSYISLSAQTTDPAQVVRIYEAFSRLATDLTLEGVNISMSSGSVEEALDQLDDDETCRGPLADQSQTGPDNG